MIDLGLLLGGMASFVGAALLVALARRHGRAHIAASGLRSPPALRVGPGQVRPRSQLPILTASELLERTGTLGALEKIRTSMGFHPDNFSSDVMPLIERFAEFVQLLPASESHHHAQPGGLLIHTLDVAAYAVALRMGYKLPTGAVVEEQIRLGPVWTFGVLVAALLHDIGKPVSDVVVQVYGVDTNTPVQTWNGLAGSMKSLVFQLATLTDVHWHMSGEVVLMTLLGGMGTILGPVVGAGIVVGLQNYLANIGSWSTIATGFIFVVCVLAFRRGVVGEIAAHFKNKI